MRPFILPDILFEIARALNCAAVVYFFKGFTIFKAFAAALS